MYRLFLDKNIRRTIIVVILITASMLFSGCSGSHGSSKLPDDKKSGITKIENEMPEKSTIPAIEAIPTENEMPPIEIIKDNIEQSENYKEETQNITENVTLNPPVKAMDGDAYETFNNSLFIGDSRTEGFQLYSGVTNATYFCAKSMTIDRIIDGEKIKVNGSKMSVYDVLDSMKFDKIYISAGLNELGWNHIETFIADYEILIQAVRERQDSSIIYIQALLPVTTERSGKDKVNNNEQIYWYNINLVDLAEKTNTTYVNADQPLVDENGALKKEATTDGIHLKSEYCKIWAQYLAEIS